MFYDSYIAFYTHLVHTPWRACLNLLVSKKDRKRTVCGCLKDGVAFKIITNSFNLIPFSLKPEKNGLILTVMRSELYAEFSVHADFIFNCSRWNSTRFRDTVNLIKIFEVNRHASAQSWINQRKRNKVWPGDTCCCCIKCKNAHTHKICKCCINSYHSGITLNGRFLLIFIYQLRKFLLQKGNISLKYFEKFPSLYLNWRYEL